MNRPSFALARRATLTTLTTLAACAAWVLAPAHAQDAKPVRVLTNWFAQADQGGYWQAQQDDLGRAAGLKITVQQGGPRIQTIPQVASGQAEFGVGNADDVLLARQRGVPIKAVFAHLDHVPYTLVYHANPAVKSINDLQGRPFAVSLGFAYWEWAKKQYKIAPSREMPVTGDLGLFRNDPTMVQQGLYLYLPARMKAAGIEVDQIKIATLGYRPYYVLFTTDELIQKNPQLVKATVAAMQKGWANFMRDPQAIKPYLMGLNQQISSDVHDAATRDMANGLVSRDPAKMGCMADSRWKELSEQLKSVNFLPADFDEKQAYDTRFVPGC
ncbi:MAG: ABC transporter substrate-binding protein [Hydrogenophaga sp.]|uniref:ABC transporter substrate-binding protein n=1 Tax=Hydrogenophaga sp. TaxID=1904254 RepID=UPI001D8AFA6D|nr:ABC transporter substrate-binding protein [Hydrogenophaga sp.]MBX3611150.1 ABC transporter substrate-binding protein [Hydrogenophaga sp.]